MTVSAAIAVTNHGPSEAVDVTVEDETNGNLTTITDRPDECPGGGLTLTCPLGTLEPRSPSASPPRRHRLVG